MWIVVVNMPYYPYVRSYEDFEEAYKAYEEALKTFEDDEATIYIAEVHEHTYISRDEEDEDED